MSRRKLTKTETCSGRAISKKISIKNATQRPGRGWNRERIERIIAILNKFEQNKEACAHGEFKKKVDRKYEGLSYVSLHELHSAWKRLRDRKRTGSRWFKAALKKMGQKRTAALARLPESERWKAWKEGIKIGSGVVVAVAVPG